MSKGSAQLFTSDIDHDAATIAAIDARCHKVIRASAVRHGWVAVEDHTPLHELISREGANVEASDEMLMRQEHWNQFIDYLMADGPHPAASIRRLYQVVYQLKPERLAYMNMADLALLLGETKQAFSWRLGKLFEGKLRSRSQKRAGSKGAYAGAARGNNSRRKGERRKRREQEHNE